MKKTYKVIYKIKPDSEIESQTIEAHSAQHAKLKIKFENVITHNEIIFINQ